jgi:DNA polymerase-1
MVAGMHPPVILVDAFSLLFRAFFALPPLTTRAGEPTSALYGLSVIVLKLLREQRPKGMAFALDLPRPTFRHERYAPYKQTRAKQTRASPPSALGGQVARLPELIMAFGFPAFSSPGFEADDVLATLARDVVRGGDEALVVSGDRDSLQLAGDSSAVLYVARGVKETRYDAAAVETRFGVPPRLLPDYIALVGDPSDNLPGVPGIGRHTAAQLLRAHGSVREIVARLDEIGPPRLRTALQEVAEELPLWEDLARLRADVPLPPGPRFAPVTEAARATVGTLFERLEFTSLIGRIDEALGVG